MQLITVESKRAEISPRRSIQKVKVQSMVKIKSGKPKSKRKVDMPTTALNEYEDEID